MVFIAMSLHASIAHAQPDTLWSAQVQTPGNPIFYSAAQASNSDFVLVGETNPGLSSSNMLLARVGTDGTLIWSRSYGSTGADCANSTAELPDGSFVAAGCRTADSLILLGFNADGDSLWSRTFSSGGPTSLNDIVVTENGMIAGVGSGRGADGVHSDVLFVLFDPAADSLLTSLLGTDGTENGFRILGQADGSYIICGGTNGFGGQDNDLWLIHADQQGNILASSSIQHTGLDACYGAARVDSQFVYCGRNSVSSHNRGYVVSTDSAFDTLWTRNIALTDVEDQLRGAVATEHGGVICAGWSGGSWNSRQCWLTSLTLEGGVEWNWLHGTQGSGFYGIIECSEGGFLAFGQIVISNSRRAYAARVFSSRLEGTVHDSESSLPVSGAQVSLMGRSNQVLTDSSGRFSFAAPNGLNNLVVTRHCYSQDSVFGIVVPVDDIATVDVSLLRPLIEVSLSSVNIIVHSGQSVSTPVTVVNSGLGFLELDVSCDSVFPEGTWLSATPASAVVASGDSVVLNVLVALDSAASESSYSGSVMITSNACPLDTIHIPVFADALDAYTGANHVALEPSLQCYPNPFNAVARLTFDLSAPGHVSLRVIDILGREVSSLVNGSLTAGVHEIEFDGHAMASGIYFVHLEANHVSITRKIGLLR